MKNYYFGQCTSCGHEWGFYVESLDTHICDECLETFEFVPEVKSTC